MLEIDSLEDIAALRESVDVECKLAQGRDGELVGHVASPPVTLLDGTPADGSPPSAGSSASTA